MSFFNDYEWPELKIFHFWLKSNRFEVSLKFSFFYIRTKTILNCIKQYKASSFFHHFQGLPKKRTKKFPFLRDNATFSVWQIKFIFFIFIYSLHHRIQFVITQLKKVRRVNKCFSKLNTFILVYFNSSRNSMEKWIFSWYSHLIAFRWGFLFCCAIIERMMVDFLLFVSFRYLGVRGFGCLKFLIDFWSVAIWFCGDVGGFLFHNEKSFLL